MKVRKSQAITLFLLVFFLIIFIEDDSSIRSGVVHDNANKSLLHLANGNDGSAEWYRTWGGTEWDSCKDIVLDSSENILLVGDTRSFGLGEYDMCLVKYDSSGNYMWNTTWGGDNSDHCNGIALDSSENIYLAGYSYNFSSGWSDMRLVKFDKSGNYLWNTTWGGSDYDMASDIVIDSSGNFFLTGYTYSYGAGHNDLCLVKFDNTGNYLWNTTWGGVDEDVSNAIAVDLFDNICITGYTTSFGVGKEDICVVKFDNSGNYLWNTTWGGSEIDTCHSLTFDIFNNIFLAGTTNSYGEGLWDAVSIKLDSSGDLKWNFTWGGFREESGMDITLDPSENIYITGRTTSFGEGDSDMYVLKLDNLGNSSWYRIWGLETNDQAFCIAIDSSNNIYLGGETLTDFDYSYDICLVKNPKSAASKIAGYDIFLLYFIIVVSLVFVLKNRILKKHN